MKTLPLFAASLLLFAATTLRAQSFVTESPVTLTGTVLTQGTDNISRSSLGVSVTVKKIVSTPFSNREVLNNLLARDLITGSTSGWSLVYLSDSTHAGIFAKKNGAAPVAVPADLLTLPVFGAALDTGIEVKGPNGSALSGAGQVALATCTVDNLPVSGFATNGTYVLTATIDGKSVAGMGTVTTLNFTGGVSDDVNGDKLIKGVLVIGKGKVSGLAALPSL
jgi:hypothetical protein